MPDTLCCEVACADELSQNVGVTRLSDSDVFTPPGVQWVRVSSNLTKTRRLEWSLVTGLLLIVVVGSAFIPGMPLWLSIGFGVAVVIAFAWGWWYFARRTGFWGYCERTDDLIVTRGFMFRRLVIVPYGRMQLVDVSAGPLERKFNISTLRLHTAAATTDAKIPGLEPNVAGLLRDRLSRLAEERAAGL